MLSASSASPLGPWADFWDLGIHLPTSPPAPVGQKHTLLPRRLPQSQGHTGGEQEWDRQDHLAGQKDFSLSAAGMKSGEAALSHGTPSMELAALYLPSSLIVSVLGHTMEDSASPQPPALHYRVGGTGPPVLLGLGELYQCTPHGLQFEPCVVVLGVKAGLCLPTLLRVGVSVTPTPHSVNSLSDAPSLPLPGTATA